jgi:serine/threonine protein kinase
MNVAHLDLKPGNILLKGNTAKICDLGSCRLLSNIEYDNTEHGKTLRFMDPAPEPGNSVHFNSSSDIYSFGVLMWCLIFDEPYPYNERYKNMENSEDLQTEFKMMVRSPQSPLRPDLHNEQNLKDGKWKNYVYLFKLMQECWEKQQSKRPKAFKLQKRLHSKSS